MAAGKCPSDETWSAYLAGTSANDRDALVEHLAQCEPCRTLVSALARQRAGGERPAKEIGRFVVLEVLGRGGLGVVYSAFDPRLARKVALKVVRQGVGASQERMLREAQALAKLDHPNVVPIHEVLEHGGEVILVMEQVQGQTLADWTEKRWRDTLDAYLQAAEGLIAAHNAGMVHRDFKPQNAIMGDDGRVRVIDFGLVHGGVAPTRSHPVDATGDTHAVQSATRDGAVVGTPQYMSPEQRRGEELSPKADVYSFCVSLDGVLEGAPARVRKLVARGRSDTPTERPHLPELVQGLKRKRRARWPVAAGTLAALALGSLVYMSLQKEVCTGGSEQISHVWNTDRRSAVEATLLTSLGPYAPKVTPRVIATIDRYTKQWALAHRDACLSHDRGEQSSLVLDKRMHCLERRRTDVKETLRLLTEPKRTTDPVRLVMELPRLEACGDLDFLASEEPRPRSKEQEQRAMTLRKAMVLERNGEYTEARRLAERISPDDGRLGARATLVAGRSALLAGHLEQASALLESAQRRAVRAGLPGAAAEAIARRIFAAGITGTLSDIGEFENLAEDLLAREASPTFVRALLYNNIGVVERNRGNRNAAETYLHRALKERDKVPHFAMELGVIPENLAAVVADKRERARLLAGAIADFDANLGPEHPETLRTQVVLASSIPSPKKRQDALQAPCERIAELHPRLVASRAFCALERGWAAREQAQPEAVAHLERAAGLFGAETLMGRLAAAQAKPSKERFESLIEAIGDPGALTWKRALRGIANKELAALTAGEEAALLADKSIADLSPDTSQHQWALALTQAREILARERPNKKSAALLEEAQRWYRANGYD